MLDHAHRRKINTDLIERQPWREPHRQHTSSTFPFENQVVFFRWVSIPSFRRAPRVRTFSWTPPEEQNVKIQMSLQTLSGTFPTNPVVKCQEYVASEWAHVRRQENLWKIRGWRVGALPRHRPISWMSQKCRLRVTHKVSVAWSNRIEVTDTKNWYLKFRFFIFR